MDFASHLYSRHQDKASIEKIKIYVDFCISNSVERVVKLTERHHVLPKSTFPEFKSTKENIVNLSLSNHIRAHILLMEAIPCSRYVLSVKRTLGNIPKSEDDKEILINLAIEAKSKWKDILIDDNPNLGKKRTKETRELMSRSQLQARIDNPDSYPQRYWITNGDESKFIPSCDSIPDGWYEGRPIELMEAVRQNAIGRIQSDDEKLKRSISLKMHYDVNDHHMQSEDSRKKRSEAWSTSNPSKTDEFKAGASCRSKARWKDPEYIELMKKTGMKNKGKVQYCNLKSRELARFVPGTEPAGWIRARGLVERSEGKLKIKDGIY